MRMKLLALETAGSLCSAAVLSGRTLLAVECRPMRHGHGEALLPMIDRVVRAAGLTPRRLDHVAVSVGPGGFTGVRVGLAAAQGIARGAGARLVGVTSFAAVAARLAEAGGGFGEAGALLVALDSRREDLYVQAFAADGSAPIAAPRAILPESLAAYIETTAGGSIGAGRPLLIAGDAARAAAAALDRHRACEVATDLVPEARGVAAAALRQLQAGNNGTPPLPLYLRPPDVTVPRPIAP
jgi:tRNA threonylcarbamoyladenosine biosynthesis protein TsaB